MGIGVGCIGLSVEEFCRLGVTEFSYIYKHYTEAEAYKQRDKWERTRTLAAICIQPYSKRSLKPKDVLPLPWDSEQKSVRTETVGKDEAMKMFEKLMQKM